MKWLWQLVRRNRVAALVVMIILLLAVFIGWNLLTPRTDPRLEAIRKQGYPVTLAELNAWYAPVPSASNVALFYTNAFAQPIFSQDLTTSTSPINLDSFPPGKSLSAETKQVLAAFLVTNEPALRLLHSVPSDRSRYPVDLTQGFEVPLPHLSQVKSAVLLLGAEALLACANGENDQAVQALTAAGRAADSLSEEPLLISQLVRIACWNIITSRLNRILNMATLTDEQLAALQKMLSESYNPQAFIRGFVGERANGVAIFIDRQIQVTAFSGFSKRAPTQGDKLGVTAFFSLYKAAGLFEKDKSFYLDSMAVHVAAAKLPFPDRVKLSQQTGTTAPGRFYVFSRMLLPALSGIILKDADHAARVRAAQTALAIERFRGAHGNALPASLEELTPTYLNAVPADPYDGKPLRFKKLDAGYVVYSIGRDGQDDGAHEQNTKSSKSPHDINFAVGR